MTNVRQEFQAQEKPNGALNYAPKEAVIVDLSDPQFQQKRKVGIPAM